MKKERRTFSKLVVLAAFLSISGAVVSFRMYLPKEAPSLWLNRQPSYELSPRGASHIDQRRSAPSGFLGSCKHKPMNARSGSRAGGDFAGASQYKWRNGKSS